ncbi:Zn-dependent hydrolase [Paenibacillus abyssi]|uniref:Zn-dependent hydrolase n=1 Tax=Paenibacillus abyssi TaxID=1340531 RepID=A0A917LEN1_9BACL|nr:Zn-dependent hydrolase [Paenibacillus abyssi]GGG16559.1 Zn-dependent hydrolase [Paenibacillus abyssi]
MVNSDRLWKRIFELAEVGKQKSGGITRLSFTEEDKAAKTLVASYMKEAGLTVREDAIGNLIGRKEGKTPDAPLIVLGSHIDTVPNGGSFDGALGVLSGIEVLHTLHEQGVETDSPIEVIAFTDEEGTRFQFGMIGSRAFAGILADEQVEGAVDSNGTSLAQAMRESGFNPQAIADAARKPGSIKAYLEVHIEQGKVLENRGLPVGIVSGIAGPLWMKWVITGEAGHAGATPMGLRKDPLAAAARLMSYFEEEASKYPNAVATVGTISVKPGGVNVIPGQVEFTLDLRDIDEEARDEVESRLIDFANKVCEERGVDFHLETLQRVPPVPCSEPLQQVIRQAVRQEGLEDFCLPSGAGHDGMQFKELCPVGMIFVRSKDGVSHNPAEWSSKEDCGQAADVLYRVVSELSRNEHPLV